MIIFANSDGTAKLILPSAITQGGVDANEIALVCPFPSAVVSIAFTLPNGLVIGPKIASYPVDAQEYTLTQRGEFAGYYVYTYKLGRSVTALSGTLGIQFFINTYNGNEDAPLLIESIPTNLVNVPIYNGSRYLPKDVNLTSNEELMAFVSTLKGSLDDLSNDAVSKSKTNEQTIASPVKVSKIYTSSILPLEGGALDLSGVEIKDGNVELPQGKGLKVDKILPSKAGGDLDLSGVSVLINHIKSPKSNSHVNIEGVGMASGVISAKTLGITENASIVKNLSVGGDLDLSGNLNLKGKPISQSAESLVVKDNVIIVNSSGAEFSTSGLVMKAPNGVAYGLMYSPYDDAVMVGKGTVNEYEDENGNTTYEFTFNDEEAIPLAARSGFNAENGGYIPKWDAEKNAFMPSELSADSIATKEYVQSRIDEELGDLEKFFNELNNGGTAS